MRELAHGEGEGGHEPAVVRSARLHRCAVRLAFEDDHRRIEIRVDAEIVGGTDRHLIVVATAAVDDPSTALDALRMTGRRDDVLEDHVVGQTIEGVLAVRPRIGALTNDEEEGSVGPEVRLRLHELGRPTQSVELTELLGCGYPANVAKVQWLPSGSSTVKSRDG